MLLSGIEAFGHDRIGLIDFIKAEIMLLLLWDC